jgi:hypothetical protein
MSFPSYALPSYALPSRALSLIHEYSQPLTKPDWRNSKPIISTYHLYLSSTNVLYFNTQNKLRRIVLNNIGNTEWYLEYEYIRSYGLY